jgi:ribonuclease E
VQEDIVGGMRCSDGDGAVIPYLSPVCDPLPREPSVPPCQPTASPALSAERAPPLSSARHNPALQALRDVSVLHGALAAARLQSPRVEAAAAAAAAAAAGHAGERVRGHAAAPLPSPRDAGKGTCGTRGGARRALEAFEARQRAEERRRILAATYRGGPVARPRMGAGALRRKPAAKAAGGCEGGSKVQPDSQQAPAFSLKAEQVSGGGVESKDGEEGMEARDGKEGREGAEAKDGRDDGRKKAAPSAAMRRGVQTLTSIYGAKHAGSGRKPAGAGARRDRGGARESERRDLQQRSGPPLSPPAHAPPRTGGPGPPPSLFPVLTGQVSSLPSY